MPSQVTRLTIGRQITKLAITSAVTTHPGDAGVQPTTGPIPQPGPGRDGLWKCTGAYSAASLSFLKNRAFNLTLAGLALNTRSTLVNGSMPLRAFFGWHLLNGNTDHAGQGGAPAPFLADGGQHGVLQRGHDSAHRLDIHTRGGG